MPTMFTHRMMFSSEKCNITHWPILVQGSRESKKETKQRFILNYKISVKILFLSFTFLKMFYLVQKGLMQTSVGFHLGFESLL